jgi:hypothetical protein
MKFTNVLWTLLILGLVLFCANSYFSVPDVYWSYSQDKCVKIVHDGINLDCSTLPETYRRIWVK